MIGTSLGHYRVLEPLGKGGMGEVYLGEDPRLGRKVAIKVLPPQFAGDPERLARFEQEARAAAALSHPHIAVVHDVGMHVREDGEPTHFMVQEYLEGNSLRDTLAKGPLSLDRALQLGAEVAEALAAAHKAGIVHRDLKPDNIFVTREGHAKVLDFGLAKLTELRAPDGSAASLSPTALGTVAGQVMGTAGYMAPEQARGDADIDRRADLFAFGCVLYETATRRRPFEGRSVAETLSKIQHDEPLTLSETGSAPPAELQRIVGKCLRKDRGERYQAASDLAVDLRALRGELAAGTAIPLPVAGAGIAHRASFGMSTPVAIALAAFTLAAGFGAGRWFETLGASSPPPVGAAVSTTIYLPDDIRLPLGGQATDVGFDSPSIALSPDGSLLVFVGMSGGTTRLYRRALAGFEIEAIPGTEGAIHPFFSPDGQWLGFLTNDQVKRVSLQGDPPQPLCDAVTPVTATWARDGQIYFTRLELTSLWRVDAGGGECVEVAPQTNRRLYGKVLPDGEWALITDQGVHAGADHWEIHALSLASGETRALISNGYDPHYIDSGHILFGRAGGLYLVDFDPQSLSVTSDPVPVARDVRMDSFFAIVQAAAAGSGLLAYVPGGDAAVGRMAWIERDGTSELLPQPERLYGAVDLSPDDNRIAVHVADVNDYIGIYTIDRNEWKRLRAPRNDGWPQWSHDGRRLAFVSREGDGLDHIVVQDADDPDSAEVALHYEPVRQQATWHPSGRVLAIQNDDGATTGWSVAYLDFPSGPDAGVPDALFVGGMPSFSPGGDHVVYNSAEAGQTQVYVRSYPGNVLTGPISAGYGIEPRWCAACDQIFFRRANEVFSVPVSVTPSFSYQPPAPAFEAEEFIDTPALSFDVTADGQRLLVVKRARTLPLGQIRIVQNWLTER